MAMADADLREHREKLNRLLGLWGADTDWKVGGKLPAVPESDPPLKGLESLAVSQRLDLAAAQADLAGIVRALGLTKSYRYIGALEFGIDTEHNPDRSNVTGPTLRLELPIFNQGQARIAKGEAELRRAERRFEGLAIEIRSEVRELRDQLQEQARNRALLSRRSAAGKHRHRQADAAFLQRDAHGQLTSYSRRKSQQVRAERGSIEALRGLLDGAHGTGARVGGSLTARQASRIRVQLERHQHHTTH